MDAGTQERLVVGDRVLVVRDGKTVKGRVADVNANTPSDGQTDSAGGQVRVTTSKEDAGTFHSPNAVIPLYRYIEASEQVVTRISRRKVGLLPTMKCGLY